MTPVDDSERARSRRQALRSAWAMVATGAVLLLATLVIGDERWRVAALILGVLLAGVGAFTVVWARVEETVPWRQRER